MTMSNSPKTNKEVMDIQDDFDDEENEEGISEEGKGLS
jgi:hypothetical protein